DSLQDPDRGSVARNVHADLRAELQAPQSPVPPGDGRLPAAPALRAREAAAARVPPARSARPGDGTLPLPVARAGHHARAARCGLQCVFRRRTAVAAGIDRRASEVGEAAPRRPLMTRTHARAVASDLLARVAVTSLFVMLSINILADFTRTHRVTGLLLLVCESLVVVLAFIRPIASMPAP